MPRRPLNSGERQRRISLVKRMSHALDLPMAILSLVFVVLVIVQIATAPTDPHAPWVEAAIWGIWSLFLLEFLVKLALYPDPREYFRRRWLDALVLVIPAFRILAGIRALQGLRVFRILFLGPASAQSIWFYRSIVAMRRGARGLRHFWQRSRMSMVLAVTSVVVAIAASVMVLLERGDPASRIRTFGDALWWSAALVTTVASDLNPVTPWGRVLAVLMMIYGMSVFSYLVSQLVAWIQIPPHRRGEERRH